jgi:uncharacterized membrane protein YphA (DoxX/SURF4 family)
MNKTTTILSWSLRIVAALIMLQTLYFKFTGAPESVYIFTTLGMEPWGRIGIGVGELIAAVLLLIPATAWMGAAGAVGLMSGAVFFHLTKLGIDVMGDGGQLFYYALIVLVCGAATVFIHRKNMFAFMNRFLKKSARA